MKYYITTKNEKQQDAALNFLFSLGYKFGNNGYTSLKNCREQWGQYLRRWPVIAINTDDSTGRIYENPNFFSGYTEINWDEFFSLTETPTTLLVELNDTYTAEVSKDGTIKVGCQVFTLATVKGLVVKAEKFCQ